MGLSEWAYLGMSSEVPGSNKGSLPDQFGPGTGFQATMRRHRDALPMRYPEAISRCSRRENSTQDIE